MVLSVKIYNLKPFGSSGGSMNNEILSLLEELRRKEKEVEVLEFKEGKTQYDFTKLGRYFSAMSNETNLRNKSKAWFILGIEDERVDGIRPVCGTSYRNGSFDGLKLEVANKTNENITFREIHEVFVEGKRVLMFEIPAAPNGIPISFEGQYYGRHGESLTGLSIDKLEEIRRKAGQDWSREIVYSATIDDLDEKAIAIARAQFKVKNEGNKQLIEQIDDLDDVKFLDKIRLTIKGKITKSALLLLGKEESSHLFVDVVPKISWSLYDIDGGVKDYEHFYSPFITVADRLYSRIRNLRYRYMVGQMSLFPNEVWQYDAWVLRELINNCIAHQDYREGGQIRVQEYDDRLVFINQGKFMPERIEAVLLEDRIPPNNRNQVLVEGMSRLNMIDSITSGIKRIYATQKDKYFPMPTYDTEKGGVKVVLGGKIIDDNYTLLLKNDGDITMEEIFLLDKIQKKMYIEKDDVSILRKRKLVEGRYPNIFVSAGVAENVDAKAEYIKNKSFDDEHYANLIIEYLKKFKVATYKDIYVLLENKLSDVLTEQQKKFKVKNILQKLKREGLVAVEGKTSGSKWRVVNK